jgi:two-component system C4-dicarboxylate transport response regulator DctD
LGVAEFGLVVVSQGSPKFEGRAVLERAVQIDLSLPVLVVARCLDMPCYLEAMQLGAVDYLAEPITVQELGRAVETHLKSRSALKESVRRVSKQERSAGLSA